MRYILKPLAVLLIRFLQKKYKSISTKNLYNQTNARARIFATLQSYSDLLIMRQTRFKELKRPKSDDVKDYEIKINKYRVYMFKDSNGGIVVFGGSKNNQKKDIRQFRGIKQAYIKSREK